MNTQCKPMTASNCPVEIDPRDRHPMDNLMYAHGCRPCADDYCTDMQTGEFEFTGPAILLGVCNIKGSYKVFRKVDGDCKVRAPSIFPRAATSHFPDNPSVEYSLAGDYVVEYKWDACCDNEPQFEALPYPCPCDAPAPAPAPAPAE